MKPRVSNAYVADAIWSLLGPHMGRVPRGARVTSLGCSPATVCTCGHDIDDHCGHHGLCLQCTCPIFDRDAALADWLATGLSEFAAGERVSSDWLIYREDEL